MHQLGINATKANTPLVNILYFDHQQGESEIGPDGVETMSLNIKPVAQHLELTKVEKKPIEHLAELQERIAYMLKETAKELDILKGSLTTNLLNGSFYIAANGRIGAGNTIILNYNTSCKAVLNNITINEQLHLCDSVEIGTNAKITLNIVINNFVEDDTIYLLRNNETDKPIENITPGFYYFFHEDVNGNLYDDVGKIGLMPEAQIIKLKI